MEMPKVTFRYPSKAVQYGYVEVEMEALPETVPAELLARRYARAVWEFWQAEDDEVEAMRKEAQAVLSEGLGASVVAEEKAPDPQPRKGGEEPSGKPWERKPAAAAAKPWEKNKEKPAPKAGIKPVEIEW